jgi:hypothetical protein
LRYVGRTVHAVLALAGTVILVGFTLANPTGLVGFAVVGGLFLGDYVGLTDVPSAFATAFSASASGDPATTYYSTVPFTQ